MPSALPSDAQTVISRDGFFYPHQTTMVNNSVRYARKSYLKISLAILAHMVAFNEDLNTLVITECPNTSGKTFVLFSAVQITQTALFVNFRIYNTASGCSRDQTS